MKRHSGLRRAEQLISLAKRSIGAPHAVEAYKLHLKQLLDEYDLATQQLKTIEQEIHALLEQIPAAKQMLQIKGMSAISVAGILGESGDLSGYVHGNALLRHAGLNLTEYRMRSTKGHRPVPLERPASTLWIGVTKE
jgi:transposase